MKTKLLHSIISVCAMALLFGVSTPGFSLTEDEGYQEDVETMEEKVLRVGYICVDEAGNQLDCEGIPDEQEVNEGDIPAEELDQILDEAQAVQANNSLLLAGGSDSMFSGCTLQAAGQGDLTGYAWMLGLLGMGPWISILRRRR
jgi:hypothetical protein